LYFSGKEDIHRALATFFPLADGSVDSINRRTSVFLEWIEELATCATIVGEKRSVEILTEMFINPPDYVDSGSDSGSCRCCR
jgi:hypothetical protein